MVCRVWLRGVRFVLRSDFCSRTSPLVFGGGRRDDDLVERDFTARVTLGLRSIVFDEMDVDNRRNPCPWTRSEYSRWVRRNHDCAKTAFPELSDGNVGLI
jgi:hypothetical protein